MLVEVPWGHHLLILNKVTADDERLFYLRGSVDFGWTRSVLLNQIKAAAFERSLKEGKTHNFQLTLPEHLAEQAEEALKSSYNLEFLGIGRAIKEKQLEERLIERLRDFILELGYGVCFIGRQYRLPLGGKDQLRRSALLSPLPACPSGARTEGRSVRAGIRRSDGLLPEPANKLEKADDDMPSIGVIRCAEKDNLEVEFSLKSKTNPIGAAEYELNKALPSELQGKLPSPAQPSPAQPSPAQPSPAQPSPRQLRHAISTVLTATKRGGVGM